MEFWSLSLFTLLKDITLGIVKLKTANENHAPLLSQILVCYLPARAMGNSC